MRAHLPTPFLAKSLTSHQTRQRGFTLVEVLVSVVILSIGVLGAVGMQAASLQSNREVRYQVLAASMARELAEKMRGNHTIAVKPAVADNPYLLDTTLSASSTLTAPTPNCYSASCPTGLNVAAWDIYDLQVRLRAALPSPRIRICLDAQPFTSAGVAKWDCTGTGDVAVLKLAWNRAGTKGETEFTSQTSTVPLVVLPLTAGSAE